MHCKNKKKIKTKDDIQAEPQGKKKEEEKRKEYVGAPSTSIITKLATYKDVCCAEARSVEDPSNRYNVGESKN